MEYGRTVNCSIIKHEDGNYELGFHYSDTDGRDIDYLVESEEDETVDDLIQAITESFIEDYDNQTPVEEEEKEPLLDETDEYILELEKKINDLVAENKSLKTDLNILQSRADSEEKKKEVSRFNTFEDLFDYLF